MKIIKQAALLEGKIASFIRNYIEDIKEKCQEFVDFSDEAIIYSYLEYSKYPRDYTHEKRIKYLYEKCCEYSGIEYEKVIVVYNTVSCIYQLTNEKYDINKHSLPF
jgi:hypothetical protein